jgi:hypothetical protein
MTHRCLAVLRVLTCAVAVGSLLTHSVAGQTATPKATPKPPTTKPWTPPRTANDQPDLQGVWNWALGTPLERPAQMAGKAFLTDDELTQAEQQARDQANVDRRDGAGTNTDVGRETNEFWHTRRTTILTHRTSLITDPPEGTLPPLTPEAERRRAANVAARAKRGPADSYEDRRINERCLMNEGHGPPILPNNIDILVGREVPFQIFQNSDYVAILSEELPQLRIIPLDGRPHLPSGIRQWVGDSRGRWEGTTLVIETTNLNGHRSIAGFPAENMRVVERLTRSSPDTIDYQFTVDDTTTWTKPWTASVPIVRTQGRLYEFACHEGNYGLVNILTGARAEEKAAQEAAKDQK